MKRVDKKIVYQDDRLIIHKLKGGNKAFIDFLAQKILEYSIHPVVYEFVRTRHLTPEKAFYIAQKKIKYMKDPAKVEGIIAPSKIIKEHILVGRPVYGDCDDKVLFLGSLLVSMGYPVKVVGAYYELHDEGKRKGKKINHVYLEYYDENKKRWIPLEPTSQSTRPGQIGYGVIPIYKAEISHKEGKFEISGEIVPVSQSTEQETFNVVLRTIRTMKGALATAEDWLQSYARKRGLKYQVMKMGMEWNDWIRTPMTWFLLGLLGVSMYMNLVKFKKWR